MDLEYYRKLPDYIDSSEVEKYCFLILNEANQEVRTDTISKLREMCDRQWHTYELPSSDIQFALKEWLIQNWISNSDEYLEVLMSIAFNFGLDKAFFTKALSHYDGRHKIEFQRDLDKSLGDNIDPWWSMKENKSTN